ncbi:MAG: nicotinamidase/pyrazinamidase [Oceanotoga sp.]|uniref:isochorismatase family protein n=1 Tax=Oceanotoga sp. TaxID=2108366 RepID=UPI002653AE7D|nr:isochorismatase family protein [Oceanotoga sp.]MDN5342711.1 nicotinamidase/pyrazinamidase [Oceanotoga sp.]
MNILEYIKTKFNLKNTALLCVDCQNGFTERCPSELPVKGTDEFWIKDINNFVKDIKKEGIKIFSSKDDHPKNHISFKEWPIHCVKSTFGNQLFIEYYDFLFQKGTSEEFDSYSAFYDDYELKKSNGLEERLRLEDIENLIILGLAGDVCVKETIKDALDKGFNVIVLKKFVKSVNKKQISENLSKDVLDEIEII